MRSADLLVSVVIPTIHRPHLVTRAVRSALGQTLGEVEVIVVIDGPDWATRAALGQVQDRRLRVRALARNVGLGGAINAGVQEAQGHWIALLDDDDEWLPRKLEVQLKQAQRSAYSDPIICCRFITRTEVGDLVWPRRYPAPGEALSEYLFCQHSLRGGEGSVLPSSILTTRALLKRVPWRLGLPRLNDFDWLLRAVQAEGVGLEFVPWDEPLAIYHREESRKRISTSVDWRYCRSWIQANQHLVTRRAFASFMLTAASMTAARAKARGAFWVLLWDACRHGKPRWMDILVHLIIWLVPWKLRTRMAVMLDGIGWSRLALKRDKDRNLVQPGKGLVGIPSEHRPGLGSAWKAAQGFSENTLELCWAIISGAPGTSLKELRTERGKRTFQVTVSSGATTENIILKEFGSRGPIDAVFLRHLRPGPGCRYAAAASAIRDAGVLTAHIRFAALGKAPDGPRYLIGAEEIKGAHTLGEVLTWLSAPERAGLFKTVGRAVAQLHHAGIFHFDLNEDNLLFRVGRDDLEGPYLVDLDYTVRTSVRRRQLCRLLARLDLHQFFTIRNAEIKREDRCMFKSGYRSTERQAQPISWRILLGGERASRQVRRAGGGETDVTGGEEVAGVATYSNMDMPQRKYYPRWKRIVGTSLIHLFRGVLLVCRLVH